MNLPPVLMTTSQVAAALGVDPATVRRYAIEGRLPHITLPSGHRRFRREDVEALFTTEASA